MFDSPRVASSFNQYIHMFYFLLFVTTGSLYYLSILGIFTYSFIQACPKSIDEEIMENQLLFVK